MALLDRHNIAIERQDYHAALVCMVLANVYRDPKRKPQPYTIDDFMPRRKAEKLTGVTPPDEDHLEDLLALAGSLGAEVKVAR